MLSLGIIGLPNVGKSTLFKALTNVAVDIQNYPFTTIDPNVGVVKVPDERVDALAMMSGSKKKIYATVEFIDIAGLVKGAAQGEGLGNKFLANIREVDAIAHVVRVFEDKNIIRYDNKIDPVRTGGRLERLTSDGASPANDVGIIQTELELADLQTEEKRKKEKKEKNLPPLNLLADKKIIFVLNCSESQLATGWQPSAELLKVMDGRNYIIMSAPLELILSEATQDEKKEYLTAFNMHPVRGKTPLEEGSSADHAFQAGRTSNETGLDNLVKQSYKTLGLLTFLTTGEDETRAWTAKIGDPIPKAARTIHTDFEKLFIRAEVINWKTLLETDGWSNARTKGLIRTVGRDYTIQEGDVVEIKI